MTEFTFRLAIPYFLMAYLTFGLLPFMFAKMRLAVNLKNSVDDESKLKDFDPSFIF